ncbi:protein of unknown function [Bradyrhizobium vignae]|uniref:Uncharacterized protein n=1 Tax=Bradyrhizobium vignae TaxID=1549949 RepID=A0A2U3Q547_9BRAD|nr:protein of unknown function [Bradyrhizobium vignae]
MWPAADLARMTAPSGVWGEPDQLLVKVPLRAWHPYLWMLASYPCFARRVKGSFVKSENPFWPKWLATVHGVVFRFFELLPAMAGVLMQKGPPR